MIRLLLCDDELLAIQRLQDLLGRIEGVEIVGTAANGTAALAEIAICAPDAVLLDVEMPALDGFDVVEELARVGEAAPLIVFVTAYPHFAATAFEAGAIDFLTKPIRLGRLQTAIDRIRRSIEDRSARARLNELAGQLDALRRERTGDVAESRHIWVQRRGETVRVDLDRVDWVAAEGEYVRLYLGDANYLHRESLTALLEQLDTQRFARIHRSYIVNRERISSVRRLATGSYQLSTDAGNKLPVGRSYRRTVRDMITNDRIPSD
ncbi:MAG: LytTR family DNA-binding domain-containing protein [Pseudomonadota bacterium]|jgi:DNA-binding LytR/AlgR family response regulator|uniref:Two-component system response regulator protein n=1 Tax=hydrothermal vent metagenome TaxID=652676 RepID=A0A160TGC1_9ZZZZ